MMRYIEKYISTAATKCQLFYRNFLVVTDILDEIVYTNVESLSSTFAFKVGLPSIGWIHLQSTYPHASSLWGLPLQCLYLLALSRGSWQQLSNTTGSGRALWSPLMVRKLPRCWAAARPHLPADRAKAPPPAWGGQGLQSTTASPLPCHLPLKRLKMGNTFFLCCPVIQEWPRDPALQSVDSHAEICQGVSGYRG